MRLFYSSLVICFYFLFALPSFAGDAQSVSKISSNATAGLENFGKVDDNLYRGAQPDQEGFKKLKEMGIKTIINLRELHSDEKIFRQGDFKYFSIPMNAGRIKDENIVNFLKIISDKDNLPAFVHCKYGADRTGVIVASYKMYVLSWSPQQAIDELPKFHFHTEWKNIPEYIRNFDKDRIRKLIEKQD